MIDQETRTSRVVMIESREEVLLRTDQEKDFTEQTIMEIALPQKEGNSFYSLTLFEQENNQAIFIETNPKAVTPLGQAIT